jgi:hypothetical protein
MTVNSTRVFNDAIQVFQSMDAEPLLKSPCDLADLPDCFSTTRGTVINVRRGLGVIGFLKAQSFISNTNEYESKKTTPTFCT